MRSALRSLFAMYDTTGKVVLALALVGLVSSAAMAFFFGIEISLMHGVFLVVVSIGFAIGPHLAHKVWCKGFKYGAVAIGICCLPLGTIEFYSHNGYTAGLRGVNIGDAKVQQAKYTGSHEAVGEDKEAMTREQKALAQLKLANPWAETTTAESLRAHLPALEEKLRQEERRGGCGPKCLAIKQEKAGVEGRIAIAEERNGIAIRIADLEKRLAGRREKADATEFKYSAAEQQATSIAKLVSMVTAGSLKPSALQEEAVEQSANLGMAIAAMVQPALFFFIAGFFLIPSRREEHHPHTAASVPSSPRVAERAGTWFESKYKAHCNTMGIAPVAT